MTHCCSECGEEIPDDVEDIDAWARAHFEREHPGKHARYRGYKTRGDFEADVFE